jgi:hypothetical protein
MSIRLFTTASIDPIELITTTKPVNITGGQNIGSYFFGFPLKKTKATLNLNTN